jgi:hypothetical protein
MTDTTPAAELRAAAEKLRALGMGAPANNQPWGYAEGLPSDSVRTATGWEVVYGDAPGDLRYIAAMHPGVGLALADWLDAHSRIVSAASQTDPESSLVRHALAVARQINGTAR